MGQHLDPWGHDIPGIKSCSDVPTQTVDVFYQAGQVAGAYNKHSSAGCYAWNSNASILPDSALLSAVGCTLQSTCDCVVKSLSEASKCCWRPEPVLVFGHDLSVNAIYFERSKQWPAFYQSSETLKQKSVWIKGKLWIHHERHNRWQFSFHYEYSPQCHLHHVRHVPMGQFLENLAEWHKHWCTQQQLPSVYSF